MSYTKRQFITAAFEELGLAAYVFDLQPQQLESALRRLDAMMAEWNGRGIRLGYPLPSSPEDSNIDDETGVYDRANEAIILNLAIRIAPSYGKIVMPETKINAKNAFQTVLNYAAFPPEKQFPGTLPSGAGNKPWRFDDPFIRPATDQLDAGPDSILDFE